MHSKFKVRFSGGAFRYAFAALLACAAFATSASAQTAGGTVIQNRATIVYADEQGNGFSNVSNTVTVTVANVSGLVITPDAGTRPPVVSGQQGVAFTLRVTNTGNFSDQVRFLAGGASLHVSGPATIAAAVIDVNGNGAVDAGDIDINGNAADVLSAALAQNAFFDVLVVANVNANAAAGSSVSVRLGDAANQAADLSAGEVRTVATSSVNGLREARGEVSAIIDNDAQLRLELTAPAGPIALGGDLPLTWQLCNMGARDAQPLTLANAPSGANTGIFIIVPIPTGTTLKAGQNFPAGTLYTTSPLSVSPLTATWTLTTPTNLADVKRVAFNLGGSLAAGACSASVEMLVVVMTNDASTPVQIIGDAFASNTAGATITDQSGDTASNAGDGNANFDEGPQPGSTDGNGIVQQTTLQATGATLVGPLGQPGASGPTSTNDDYTNRSVTTGIAGVPPGGTTTAGGTVVFPATVRNTGNANDTYTLTAPTVPSGFTVEVSIDGGATYTTVSGGTSVSLPVPFGSSANFLVRVHAPAGLPVLQGFETVIRATSGNTPASVNDTIARLYTGFVRTDKTTVIANATGVGGASDPVPGAEIEYAITYSNVSSAGGTGNATLTATTIVITEDGTQAPNTWGATTDHVPGSASDSSGGTIAGDAAGSGALTDTVPSLAPGQSGVFRFKRRIK